MSLYCRVSRNCHVRVHYTRITLTCRPTLVWQRVVSCFPLTPYSSRRVLRLPCSLLLLVDTRGAAMSSVCRWQRFVLAGCSTADATCVTPRTAVVVPQGGTAVAQAAIKGVVPVSTRHHLAAS